MLTVSDALNRAQDKGWSGKLIHFKGFIASMPHVGGDDTLEKNLIALSDLIIFQRNVVFPEAIQAIKYWSLLGKPVAIDLDDAYHILPPSNPAFNFWIKEGGALDNVESFVTLGNGDKMPPSQALKLLEEGLKVSAGLISPNRNLLRAWEHCVGSKQYYLQNYAERDWWEGLPDRETLKAEMGLTGKIVIGWGGSISHLDSFWGSGVFDALERVCTRYPEVVIKICGNDDRITRGLENIPTRQIVRQMGVPAAEWPRQVKSFDIGLAPLFGYYDQHRSWIKGIEYLLAGVPWVGTTSKGPNGTYADLKGYGYLIENSVRNWEDALTKIIDNLQAEQERAAQVVPVAQQNFIVDYNLDVFGAVYRKIIEDFKRDGSGVGNLLPEVVRVVVEEDKEVEGVKK